MRKIVAFVVLVVLRARICPAETASTPAISVLIYDYAGISAEVANGGLQETKRILKSGGVPVVWVHCLAAPDRLPVERLCLDAPGPLTLVVHILTRGATRRQTEPGAVGFALPPEDGGFGANAGVFHDRVKQLGPTASEATMFGHVIAHELGHLLLGTGKHSAGGIMKADWNQQQIVLAAEGLLRFNQSERRRILANMQRRMLAADARLSAGDHCPHD